MGQVQRNQQMRAAAFAYENQTPQDDGQWDDAITTATLEGMDMPSWLAEALSHALCNGDWKWLQRQVEKHTTDAINAAHAATADDL